MPAIGSYGLAGGACSATNDNSLLTQWAADSAGHWTGTAHAIPRRVLFCVPLSSMDSSLN
jgi:hypothetical protein